jgi:GT2 family glycosyltransferase
VGDAQALDDGAARRPGVPVSGFYDDPLTIGVAITNYETWNLSLRCVKEVFKQEPAIARVIIVDDHSSEPCPELPLDPRVQVLINPTNLGGGPSLNRAILEAGTDIVVVFDSDAYPLSTFVAFLRKQFADEPALGVVGFRTVDRYGRDLGGPEAEPDVLTLILGQRLHALYRRLRPASGRAICIYTPAMAIRRQAFEELGGLDDERFDFLDLDTDLSMRFNRSGWHLRWCPELLAFHEGGGSPQKTHQRVLRYYRNRWLLLRKHGRIKHPAMVRRLVLARLALELAGLSMFGRLFYGKGPRLDDKLLSRRLALRHVRDHYF